VEAQYRLRKNLNRYRITGSGQMFVSGGEIVANSSGTGRITDVPTTHRGRSPSSTSARSARDLEFALQVVGADSISTAPSTALHNAGVLETKVHLHVRIVKSNSTSCPVGRTGSIFLNRNHYRGGGHSSVSVFLCGQSDSFTNDLYAFSADDNAVRVVLVGSAFGSHPTSHPPTTPPPPKASPAPTEATIEAGGAIRGENILTGALTCTGKGYSQGTSCCVNVAQNASVEVKATLDQPLPSGWHWQIRWMDGAGQSFDCPTGSLHDLAQDGVVVTRLPLTPNNLRALLREAGGAAR
jgi:hypothetical protein